LSDAEWLFWVLFLLSLAAAGYLALLLIDVAGSP
jgi:hypothetical protein